jgi:hypothetical protein
MVSGGDFEGILALAGAIHGGFGSAWSSAARSTQHAARNTQHHHDHHEAT